MSETFELCKQVHELTGWQPTDYFDGEYVITQEDADAGGYDDGQLLPLYTSDYLLERLPYTQSKKSTARTNRLYYLSIVAGHSTGSWLAGYHRIDNRRSESVPYWWGVRSIIVGEADTPLKSLLKLTISLHKVGKLNGDEQL